MKDTRIHSAVDYERHDHIKGGSPLGVKKLRWPLWLKTVLQLWAVEYIAHNNEQVFLHMPNTVRWAKNDFKPFLKVMRQLAPDFYEELKAASVNERNMIHKVVQRHHKMYYQKSKGRQFSDEYPDNQAAKSPKHNEQVNLGRTAYMRWRNIHA